MSDVPDHIGRYEIVSVIGRGGMGIVYKAHDPNPMLARTVAIKALPPDLIQQPDVVRRFVHEARHAAALDHPHIVKIYDAGEEGGTPYFAMQYVEGQTLADAMRSRRLQLPEIQSIVADIASALDYAHAQGVVHRDIKPGNVLIDKQGTVLVADFGIARALGQTVYTQPGAMMGTPHYMAPEQAQGGEIDGRADVYALGVILYEMLAGQRPFEGDSPIAIAVKHLNAAPPPLSAGRPEISPAVEEVALKALAKSPADRFATAGALSAALRRAATSQPARLGAPPIAGAARQAATPHRTAPERAAVDAPPPPAAGAAAPARLAPPPAKSATVPAQPSPAGSSTYPQDWGTGCGAGTEFASPATTAAHPGMAQGQTPQPRTPASPVKWVIAGVVGCIVLGIGGFVVLIVALGIIGSVTHGGTQGGAPTNGASPFAGIWQGKAQSQTGATDSFQVKVQADGSFQEEETNDQTGMTLTYGGTIDNSGQATVNYSLNGATFTGRVQLQLASPNHATGRYETLENGSPVDSGTSEMDRVGN